MRILFIQNAPFETPSHLAVWAERNKHAVTVHRAYMEKGLRDAEPFDLIVPLGGSMSVHDADKLPWMKSEIGFLENAVRNGKRVLGICLGAQMIARVLGASVYPNPEREIGWHPVRLTGPGKRLPLFRELAGKIHGFSLARGNVRRAPRRGPFRGKRRLPEPGVHLRKPDPVASVSPGVGCGKR